MNGGTSPPVTTERPWGDYDIGIEARSPVVHRLAYERDQMFYRMVVVSLGAAISLSIICSMVAVVCTGSVPDGITAIGSGAVGALAGVFTASRR